MKEYYLLKANENIPPIYTKEITADAPKRVLVKGDSITVDLGDHYVG